MVERNKQGPALIRTHSAHLISQLFNLQLIDPAGPCQRDHWSSNSGGMPSPTLVLTHGFHTCSCHAQLRDEPDPIRGRSRPTRQHPDSDGATAGRCDSMLRQRKRYDHPEPLSGREVDEGPEAAKISCAAVLCPQGAHHAGTARRQVPGEQLGFEQCCVGLPIQWVRGFVPAVDLVQDRRAVGVVTVHVDGPLQPRRQRQRIACGGGGETWDADSSSGINLRQIQRGV